MMLVDRYVLAPGVCQLCRSAQREDEPAVVDTQRAVTDGAYEDGRIYICRACVAEMATMFGFTTPEMTSRFCLERDAAIRQVTALMDEVAALKGLLAAVELLVPAPAVELAETPRYACPECLAEGIVKDCNNPQGLGRHRSARHDKAITMPAKGDAVYELMGMEVPR